MADNVLIVEDDPLNREFLRVFSVSLGLDPVCVSSTEDAYAYLSTCTIIPTLAVIDIFLGGADGFELARTLRDDPATTSMTLIAVTAVRERVPRDKALSAGFDTILYKPLRPDRLREVMVTLRSH
jgi:DNA-binding response OmpR family regulator